MNEWNVLSSEFSLVCKATWEKIELQTEVDLILVFFNPVFVCQYVFYGFYST